MSEIVMILASIQMMFGDFFSIVSIIGSVILLFGSFTSLSKFGEIANWSILGLIVGALGQISIAVTQQPVEKIGVFIPLLPEQVNVLLMGSLLMLIARGFIRKNRHDFM